MKRHRQMREGSMPRPSRTAARKNRTAPKPISAHTLRFRTLYAFDEKALGGRGMNVAVGESPPIRVRNLVNVGAKPARGRSRLPWDNQVPKAMGIQPSVADGLFAAMAFAATLLTRPSMLSRRQQRKGV